MSCQIGVELWYLKSPENVRILISSIDVDAFLCVGEFSGHQSQINLLAYLEIVNIFQFVHL